MERMTQNLRSNKYPSRDSPPRLPFDKRNRCCFKLSHTDMRCSQSDLVPSFSHRALCTSVSHGGEAGAVDSPTRLLPWLLKVCYMEHALKCNETKCRAELREQAMVTTCSHIFCVDCGHRTGLTGASPDRRVCPACQTHLPRPDDATLAKLNPSEDYKTSVLSGLSPESIMECAGRGLSFWSYQMDLGESPLPSLDESIQ